MYRVGGRTTDWGVVERRNSGGYHIDRGGWEHLRVVKLRSRKTVDSVRDNDVPFIHESRARRRARRCGKGDPNGSNVK